MDNQDYKLLVNSVQNWRKEKEDYDLRRNRVFGIDSKVYFWIFGILFLYIIFIKDAKLSSDDNSSLPTANNYILYEKPDNKSNILLEDTSKVEVKVLDETKFYCKVEFTKDGKSYSGYINKDKVSK